MKIDAAKVRKGYWRA